MYYLAKIYIYLFLKYFVFKSLKVKSLKALAQYDVKKKHCHTQNVYSRIYYFVYDKYNLITTFVSHWCGS